MAHGTYHAVMGNGSTFLAPVTAYPTLTLTMALWNPEKSRKLKVKRLHYFLASGTPTAGSALVACVTPVSQARPTLSTGANGGYASTVVSSLSGGGAPGDTKAVFINAITATGPQPAWAVVGGNTAGEGLAAAVFPGHLGAFDVSDYDFVIGEGKMLGLAILSGTGTTPLFGFGVTFEDEDA